MIDIATLNTLIAAARVEVDIAQVRARAIADYSDGRFTDVAVDAVLDFAYATSALRTLEMVRDGQANLAVLSKILDRANIV